MVVAVEILEIKIEQTIRGNNLNIYVVLGLKSLHHTQQSRVYFSSKYENKLLDFFYVINE
ncbi:hypothetical protein AVL50_08370 [Flammeovirga sp. SJP92]|nr:hypothetical protein AVL50_08370 [Flammeovirga sp. SJP92]